MQQISACCNNLYQITLESAMTNLTYENRLIIENGIEKRLSFASIAKQIGKDRSTISREVKRNRTYDMGTAPKGSIKCRYLKVFIT